MRLNRFRGCRSSLITSHCLSVTFRVVPWLTGFPDLPFTNCGPAPIARSPGRRSCARRTAQPRLRHGAGRRRRTSCQLSRRARAGRRSPMRRPSRTPSLRHLRSCRRGPPVPRQPRARLMSWNATQSSDSQHAVQESRTRLGDSSQASTCAAALASGVGGTNMRGCVTIARNSCTQGHGMVHGAEPSASPHGCLYDPAAAPVQGDGPPQSNRRPRHVTRLGSPPRQLRVGYRRRHEHGLVTRGRASSVFFADAR